MPSRDMRKAGPLRCIFRRAGFGTRAELSLLVLCRIALRNKVDLQIHNAPMLPLEGGVVGLGVLCLPACTS